MFKEGRSLSDIEIAIPRYPRYLDDTGKEFAISMILDVLGFESTDEYNRVVERIRVWNQLQTPANAWQSLYETINSYSPQDDYERMIVNYGLRYALGIDRLGIIDRMNDMCPFDVCLGFDENTSLNEVQKSVRKEMIESIANQIDLGGTTIGLAIDSNIPEIISRVDEITQLRKQELERVHVTARDGRIDLKPLWLTAYGFEILHNLDLNLELDIATEHEKLKLIMEAIKDIGFELKTTQDKITKYPVHISETLCKCILWEVEFEHW
jgi:hypothetical protein